ncbi:MAG: SUMF1/EgtB/PvdO family nonheme iron enzyme [Phototrophicaceae bacterium]
MPRIFVSYRRADSKMHSDNVVDALRRAFGAENVERDIEDVPFGMDYREYIQQTLAGFDIVLVVIGRQWAIVKDDYNRKMIDNPADLVRLTVEMALQQGQMVIPVLVDQASMPVPSELPDSLAELCYRRPVSLQGGVAFAGDVQRLIDGLRQIAARNGGTRSRPASPPPATSAPPAPQPPPSFAPLPQADDVPAYAVEPETPQPVETESTPPVEPEPLPEPEPAPAIVREGAARVLPQPFDWVEIPAGVVMLPEAGFQGQKAIFVDRFWIARYPITNAQFAVFVEASDGYSNPEWWDYAQPARDWRAGNAQPKAPVFPGDEHPRTNVTWFEAVAFCRWLTSTLIRRETAYVNALPGRRAGFNITLPTEPQWQRAAQGDDQRVYPWGDDFNPNYANFRTRQTTPVTQFPKGASPYGVMDMSGNVNEWCLMPFGAASDDMAVISAQKRQVLRGGSWGSPTIEDLRVVSRLWLFPDYWNGSSGFRIVRTQQVDGDTSAG